MIEGAAETPLGIKIKVFGEIALNTSVASPKSILGADTLPVLISHLTSRTSFANFVTGIIILIYGAFYTFLSVEDWSFWRTVHTALNLKIIDLVGRTA